MLLIVLRPSCKSFHASDWFCSFVKLVADPCTATKATVLFFAATELSLCNCVSVCVCLCARRARACVHTCVTDFVQASLKLRLYLCMHLVCLHNETIVKIMNPVLCIVFNTSVLCGFGSYLQRLANPVEV